MNRLLFLTVFASLVLRIRSNVKKQVYHCTDDSYCENKFPGTACIAVDNYGVIIKKCTPNTKTRPACRGKQAGLCPSYQSPEMGYLNAHCIFVASEVGDTSSEVTTLPKSSKSAQSAAGNTQVEDTSTITSSTEGTSEVPSSRFLASSEMTDTTDDAVGDIATEPVLVKFGKAEVLGYFKCVDVAACINEAYDTKTCEPEACGQAAGATNVCNNQGTCTYKTLQKMDTRSCMCYAGFDGPKCEKTISGACDVECGIGGECVDQMCKCKPGFDGKLSKGKQGKKNKRCTTCTSDLGCQNGQPCDIEQGKCSCGAGFGGLTCGSTEDSCTKRSCGSGTCHVNDNGTSACYCPICSPDCIPCSDSKCGNCQSFAVNLKQSKGVIIAATAVALFLASAFVF